MNVLITSASRKVWLIRSFQKALKMKGEVIAVDSNPLSVALYKSHKSFVVLPSGNKDFIRQILRICQKNKVELIIPTRDEELLLFARNKKEFKKNGIMVMIGDFHVVKRCLDKKLFIQHCLKNNISVPKTYGYKDKNNYRYPLLAKPKKGKSGLGVFLIKNKNDHGIVSQLFKTHILQQYIKDDEFSIDVFADFEGRVISVVPRKRISVFGGESFISKTKIDDFLINKAQEVTLKFNLIGHNTIQCFYNEKRKHIRFIEINPRFGGGAHLSFQAGASSPHFLVQLINGKKLKSRIGKFKNNLTMLRYTKDLFLEKVYQQ